MINYLVNFSDGVYTQETQDKLNELVNLLTDEELDRVEEFLFNKLERIKKKYGRDYKVEFVPNIKLQIQLDVKKPEGPIQYGVHCGDYIAVSKMSDVNPIKGRFGELLILAHEVGHAILGIKNQIFDTKFGTHMMEKITDEAIKIHMIDHKDEFPIFYDMYELCRTTHHYKTKEGDFKQFFDDIIKDLEKQWYEYKMGQLV